MGKYVCTQRYLNTHTLWHNPSLRPGQEMSLSVGKMESKRKIKKARREGGVVWREVGEWKTNLPKSFWEGCVQSYHWLKSFTASKIYSSSLNVQNIAPPNSVSPSFFLSWHFSSHLHRFQTQSLHRFICHAPLWQFPSTRNYSKHPELEK